MRPPAGETYSDVTKPLRELTHHNARFNWTKECEDSFKTLRSLLTKDQVMVNLDTKRETRLYVDHGPTGVASRVAQKYLDSNREIVYCPVHHQSRVLTPTEMNYGKVEGESLAFFSGIKSSKIYLYG